jgi:hypothetical protein
MPMSPYSIVCHGPACRQTAQFKIAARWSDGQTGELKTYSLTCAGCLANLLAQSRVKQQACHLAPGETLEPPGVYELARGQRDRMLLRRPDLDP